MDRCHVLKELSSYLDNQLPDKRKQEIENHLLSCKVCSRELAKLKLLSEKLKTWQPPGLDADFDNSVRDKIVRWELEGGQVQMKKKTVAILVPSSVLAMILVVLFFGHMYVKRVYQGRLTDASETIGKQFGVNYYKYAGKYKGPLEKLEIQNAATAHYEPYYLESTGKAARREPLNSSKVMAGPLNSFAPPPVPTYEGTVIVIQPVLPATGETEKVIRTANIKLEVTDGKVAYKGATEICQKLGGYLASSMFYKDEQSREAGTIVMRIPKDKFLTALDQLSLLGKVENLSTDSKDISQEYANLKARLDAAMVVYNKMLEALQKRQNTIPEAVRLESELTPVLQKIEQLKNQIEYLNNVVSFTTVNLNFHEPDISIKVLQESKRFIREGMLKAKIRFIRSLADAIPTLVVVFVLLVVIIVIAVAAKVGIPRLFKRG